MKTILLAIVCLVSVSAAAQQTIKFRSYLSTARAVSEPPPTAYGWNSTNILVVVARDKIDVYSRDETHIDLLGFIENRHDDPTASWVYRWRGVDQNGLQCDVMLEVYDDTDAVNSAYLTLQYSDAIIYYRLKNN